MDHKAQSRGVDRATDPTYFTNHKVGLRQVIVIEGNGFKNILRIIKWALDPAPVQFVGQPETLQLYGVSNTS